jgi:hypothetical protein
VLTFFAQDCGTHNLVYANADISKATQNREVIAFADHWKTASGHAPAMLVMDQKVTTHAVLGELDARGITFLTLRMRSPALIKQINALTPGDYKTITLDRPGPHNTPRVHEPTAVKISNYPGTVRQFIVTGLGRDAPTVIITNEHDDTTKHLIERYARRMTIEQRLAEIIRAFHADALSSAVNLNVDLDIVLAVLAQACSPPYASASPATPPSPPTPSNDASSTPPARSSTTATPSPSASTAAPTHPSYTKQTYPPTSPLLTAGLREADAAMAG